MCSIIPEMTGNSEYIHYESIHYESGDSLVFDGKGYVFSGKQKKSLNF
jgi:hypothetical protein